jgi:small subunit ribosomal protein S17
MKILTGKIISDKMSKTIVVEIKRLFRHPMYGKLMKRDKKFKVHSEKQLKVGDVVQIRECKKKSKDKYFEVV